MIAISVRPILPAGVLEVFFIQLMALSTWGFPYGKHYFQIIGNCGFEIS